MQWQNKLPLIAILRGIKPDEAHAHVEAVIAAGLKPLKSRLIPPTGKPVFRQWSRRLAIVP
jgi:2-dehydro-3-deoxyphosphogalactonate aldolase